MRRRISHWIGWALAATFVVSAGGYFWWSRAHLDLTSVPAGADVSVDGQLVGQTPLEGLTLAPGLHLIELRHSHYAAYSRQLRLPPGETTALNATLDEGIGELLLYSNPRGAWAEVDGVRRDGTTPLLVKLPSGAHEIAMGMEERRAATATVTVMADQHQELHLDLGIVPYGALTVETVPADARVTLPGTEVEYVPGVRLPLGEYPVAVSRRGYESREQRLEVGYGDNHYAMTLPRAFARLKVRTTPADARVRLRYRQSDESTLAWHDYRSDLDIPTGEVELQVRAMGRRSVYRHLDLPPGGSTVTLTLEPMHEKAGQRLRDTLKSGGQGPEMVVVPAGSFLLGSPDGAASERPVRRMDMTEPFAVGVTEVTVADFRRFTQATGREAQDPGGDGSLPATRMSFAEAAAYADWLSIETGSHYRLLSEAEWEYMARAGGTGSYFFGDDATALCRYGNVADASMQRRHTGFDVADCDDGFAELAPVGSFPANAFGIKDVIGNVAEWVMECGLPSYAELPDDGSPLDAGIKCPTHGVRGGSWDDGVDGVRTARRGLASSASASRGTRLARDL